LQVVHGRVAGRPAIDLALEVRTQALCRRAIGEGIIASAHDCSDGGLAVALGECCIQGGVGFRAGTALSHPDASGRWDVALFGERQSRIVVSLPPQEVPRLEALAAELGVPTLELGVTGGHRFQLGRYLDLPLDDLADAWGNGLERALGN
jgi:phosphoribosylformylglycinamidine synthase